MREELSGCERKREPLSGWNRKRGNKRLREKEERADYHEFGEDGKMRERESDRNIVQACDGERERTLEKEKGENL